MKLLPVLLILIGIAGRMVPHPPNFAPITAIALFGGFYLPGRYALLVTFAALFLSDLLIGFYGQTMIFVYLSFLISNLVGIILRGNKKLETLVSASLICSIIFFLVTNFGVWLDPLSSYPKTFNGLMQSYFMAIPFFRNTFLGDLFYTGVLFGSYEILAIFAKNNLPAKYKKLLF